jgi:hypothetical protein
MISKKQEKNYDSDVSTIDLSLALFILSVSIITFNSLLCVGSMLYANYKYSHINSNNHPIIVINKNLYTGIWYNMNSSYSNLHIYQNDKVSFTDSVNTTLLNGYIDYKTNAIYTNSTNYNISYVHDVNNVYSFTILYDNVYNIYHVYRKYDYVVNVAFIKKLLSSLK